MALQVVIPLIVVWLGMVYFFHRYRIWLLFYLVGSVGLAFILIFVGRELMLERGLEVVVANLVHWVCNWAGIPTRMFQAAPGALLIMVVGQDIGWTIVQITIECSGLLETAAMLGMVLMYPGWPMRKRMLLAVTGSVAIFIANIIRLFIIIEVLHYVGKDSIFIAHTIAGRAIFFVIVVLIYWYVITRPTLKDVRRKLHENLTA
jgi:exosortase family protein XrtG